MTHPHQDSPYWLAWQQIPGLGPHRIKRLYQQFGSLAAAWGADEQSLMQVEGIGLQLALTIQATRPTLDPQRVWQQATQSGIRLLTPGDPDYPALLWEIPDPPPVLYVIGEMLQWAPAIAIVGTRAPTAYGRRWTETIATALAQAGAVVVSGMAKGIDGVAHQACLKAGGITVAVLGTGVDRVYPTQHRTLYQDIRTQGLLVSEFVPGTQPAKENFPRRNRIIAGLCQATLVIEAPERSGALITAYLANDYNRDVFALPGNIDVEAARGCLRLIRTGAGLILDVEELLAELNLVGQDPLLQSDSAPATGIPSSATDPSVTLSGPQLAIWQALEQDPLTLDTLSDVTQLDISVLSSELLMMELDGVIVQLPGLRYQRA